MLALIFFARGKLLDFISDEFYLQDFLWRGLINHESRRWEVIPFLSGDDHHENSLFILNINQCVFFYSSTRGIVSIFYLLRFSEWFCIFFEIFLCRAFTVSRIATFYPTLFAGDVIKVSSDFFNRICFQLHLPQFSHAQKHKLVADTLILGLPIRVIIGLLI